MVGILMCFLSFDGTVGGLPVVKDKPSTQLFVAGLVNLILEPICSFLCSVLLYLLLN